MNNQTTTDNRSLTIKVNFTWNFIGKLVYAASRALILVLIAKLGSSEMVGQYALAFAITTPIFMLADLDLRSVLVTNTKNSLEFGHYLGLRLLTTLSAFAVVCILAILQGARQTATIILLVGAAKGIESISDILFGLMQKNERLDRLGISLMIKGFLSLLTMGLLVWQLHSLAWGAAGLVLAWLAVMLLYDIPSARPFAPVRIFLTPQSLWPLAKLSLPLGIVLLFSSLNKNLSNYFIEAFHGSEYLGYFSAIVYIMATGSLVISALSQSTNARLARLFSQGDKCGFVRILTGISVFAVALGACMLLLAAVSGGQILTLLYRPEYAVWQNVFVLVMGAACISYLSDIMASALTAAHNYAIQPFISGSVLLIGFVINFLLVPGMGLMGAALCLLVTAFLQLAGNLSALALSIHKSASKITNDDFESADKEASNGLTVKRISSVDALTAEFVSSWKMHLDRNGSDLVFADPDWLCAWWQTFGARHELLILAVYDKGELVAVFPLMLVGKHFLRRVTFIGYPQATHMDIACRTEYLNNALAAALGYLRAMKRNIIINLIGLKESGIIYQALEKRLKVEHTPLLAGSAPSPILHLFGQDFDTLYRNRFSPETIKKNRRDENRLAALGKISYREIKGGDMAEAYRLHDLRWRKKLDTSGFTHEESSSFFTGLADSDHGRWKTLVLGLYLDKRLIAFQYGFVCGERALLYKSAHDDLFGIYAPGMMIKREYCRRCLGMGVGILDFGSGYENYKGEWTDDQDTLRSISFPVGDTLSRISFLYYFAKGAIRNRLKQSRKAVLFKRNTLGRLIFHLSPGHMVETYRRVYGMIARRGGHEYLLGCFHAGRPVELSLQEGTGAYTGIQCYNEEAVFHDVDELALLANCTEEEVIKRFYRLNRCYVIRKCYAIVCAIWASTDNGRIKLSGFCMDRKLCREQDVVMLLQGILAKLPEQARASITLELGSRDTTALRAAHFTGFITVPGKRDNVQRAAGKGKTAPQIRIINTIADLEPYVGAWNDILLKNGNDNPYLTPDWIMNWWKFFGHGKELYILMLVDKEKPMGFCPLMIIKKRLYRDVQFIGSPQVGRMGLVIAQGYWEFFVKQVIGHLLSIKGNVVFTLRGMNQNDMCYKLIRKALGKKLCFVRTLPSSIIDLSSTTQKDFFKARQRHSTIGKTFSRERSLEKLCNLEFVKLSPEDINIIFPLHEKRWLRKIDGNGFAKGVSKDFFAWIARKDISSFWDVSAYLLKAGRKPIGFTYGIQCNGRFTGYRLAHDDGFALFKPGMIVVKRLLEECFTLGYKLIDFSTGDENYKKYWTDDTEWIDSIQFGTNTAVAAAVILASILKDTFRKLLRRSEILVHFKRVTLGRIRYFLSGAPILACIRKVRRTIKDRGLMWLPYLLDDMESRPFRGGGTRIFNVHPASLTTNNCAVTLHTAALDDADMLSGLTNMETEKMVERYYKGSQCQILLQGSGPVGFAWKCDSEIMVKDKIVWRPVSKGDCCVYDICFFKHCENELAGDVLTCLAGQPLPGNCHTVQFLLKTTDHKLMYAAERLFSRQNMATPRQITWKKQPNDNHSIGKQYQIAKTRSIIRQFVLKLTKYLMLPFGAIRSLAKPASPITILMYHRINDGILKELSVTTANFRWQMEYLKRKGYKVISLDEAIHLQIPSSGKARGKYVVLTFDDGYEDFLLNAFPVLQEYNYPSIVYLVSGYIGTGKVFWWDKDIGKSRLMNWNQIQSLQNSNIVQFGSHSMTHTDLDLLDDKHIEYELKQSRDTLQQRLAAEINHFAYPRGIVSKKAINVTKELYQTAVSIFDGDEMNFGGKGHNLLRLKRIPVQRSDGRHLFFARLNGWLIIEEWIKKVIGHPHSDG